MVNWWNMVFSLLKFVHLGKLATCVFLDLCKNMFMCTNICAPVRFCLCVFCRTVCIHECSYTYSTYHTLNRWVLHGCDQQRPEPCFPDRQYKPNKYHETCRVQLWSEVNTCLCWHKHTLNRCVIQIWGQIAAQRSASVSLKRSVTAIGVVQEGK